MRQKVDTQSLSSLIMKDETLKHKAHNISHIFASTEIFITCIAAI
jgi:hypothetical protein